jgi:hypothetical protein
MGFLLLLPRHYSLPSCTSVVPLNAISNSRKFDRYITCPPIFLNMFVILVLVSACGEGNDSTKERKSERKISSSLHSVREELESKTENKEQVLTFIDKSTRINEQGEIQIYIQLHEIDESKLEDLKKNGVTIDIYDNKRKLVQGWASPSKIKIISELPSVKSIDLPTYGVSN